MNFGTEKLGVCRKFAGYPKDSGSKFLREFDSFCNLHDIDVDGRKQLASFHLHLEGPALAWFNGLSPDLTWRTIRKLFIDKYVRIGWEHPSVVIESETFHNMELVPSQEIEDYCQVQEKDQLLGKPEHEVMFRFINGLPDKLAFYVRSCQPKDLYSALSYAKQGEANKYRVHSQCSAVTPRKNDISNSRSQSDDISAMKSEISHLTKLVENLTTNKAHPPSNFETSSTRCYNCNGVGHMKRLCKWNGSGSSSPDIECQLCQQNGHCAIQCIKFQSQSANVQDRNQPRVVY